MSELYDPSDRGLHTGYRVFFIEKLIINFALPSDLVFHTMRAYREAIDTGYRFYSYGDAMVII